MAQGHPLPLPLAPWLGQPVQILASPWRTLPLPAALGQQQHLLLLLCLRLQGTLGVPGGRPPGACWLGPWLGAQSCHRGAQTECCGQAPDVQSGTDRKTRGRAEAVGENVRRVMGASLQLCRFGTRATCWRGISTGGFCQGLEWAHRGCTVGAQRWPRGFGGCTIPSKIKVY